MLIRTLARRAAAAATGGALVATGLLVAAPAPQAHADTVERNAAATWLSKQLGTDGLLGGDVAKTIDFALALDEIGGQQATVDKIAVGVDAKVNSYAVDGVSYAQAALFYQATGVDPETRAGGLITKLEGAVNDATGEMAYPWGGAWSQALAVRALHAAGSDEAAKATGFLVASECPTGGWGYLDGGVCTADPDDTADMLFALFPQQGDSAEIDAAIAAGVAWLKSAQKPSGGFENYGENASSTGLAAHALALTGADAEAQKAAVWLSRRQVAGTACDGKLSGQAGAVPASDTVLAEGRAGGIDPAGAGYDWYLATAQSIVALESVPAAGALRVSAPAFVHASTSVKVTASGLPTGAYGCVTLAGKSVRVEGASATLAIAVPAGTHRYAATLSTLGGSKSVAVQALAAKTLKVSTARRVKAGTKLTVKVTGLAAQERVTVTLGTKKVVRSATAAGKVTVKVKVGKKKGMTTVKVRGHFADRKGKATIRVR
ncbi:prenyltransferase/squalene oxidase repeat-containing protein [Nocardioides sp. WV_118_6]